MNALRAYVGWGVVIYAIMFLAWSGFVLYDFTGGLVPRLAILAVLIAITAFAGTSLRLHSWRDAVSYSLVWMIVVGVFDAIYSVPYAGWGLYTDWNVWVGYLLVLAVPPLAVALSGSKIAG